eukprot:484197-Pelagomonas_calceolata.AAC.5
MPNGLPGSFGNALYFTAIRQCPAPFTMLLGLPFPVVFVVSDCPGPPSASLLRKVGWPPNLLGISQKARFVTRGIGRAGTRPTSLGPCQKLGMQAKQTHNKAAILWRLATVLAGASGHTTMF